MQEICAGIISAGEGREGLAGGLDDFLEESAHRALGVVEAPGKEMVCAFHPVEPLGVGKRLEEGVHLSPRAIDVASSLNNEFGFAHIEKETEVHSRGWQA